MVIDMKMLVSDYDDTFYLNDVDIKNNIKLANEFMKDNMFVIATGRTYTDFKKKEKLYNIKYDYLIINHGATILKDDKIIYNKVIDNSVIKDIINELDISSSSFYFVSTSTDGRANINSNDITKIHVRYDNSKKALEIRDKILDKYKDYVQAFMVFNDSAIELVNASINKKYAIDYIIDKEHLNKDNVYTVGNGLTDCLMIKEFNGYSMKNGVDELKNVALDECESVYNLIERII